MRAKTLAPAMMVVFLVLALLAGCAPAPTPTATPIPPTATPIPPTETPVRPTPTAEAADDVPVWDYVVLGGSISEARPGYPDPYAAHIEEDLGVRVKVHRWTGAGFDSVRLLRELRGLEVVRDLLREAEVVTFQLHGDLMWPQHTSYKTGNCGGEDNLDCFRDVVASFPANYDAIIAELLEVCAPDTIIRTMTDYNSFYHQHQLGRQDDLSPFYKAMNEHIMKAASQNNIPVVDVYLAFNGPDGREDPNTKGYIQSDYIHITKEGYAVITRLLHELGYEPRREGR